MALPTITGVGRLVDDAELRFTSGGKAVARMRIAFSERKKDPNTNQWVDGEKCFLDAEAWEQMAECVAESLSKGAEVLVSGRLRQRSFQDREGNNRTVFELRIDSIGPNLKFASAKVQKMSRSSGGGGVANTTGADGKQYDDPWATASPAAATSARGGFDEAPPF